MTGRNESIAFCVGLGVGMIVVAIRTETMVNFWIGFGVLFLGGILNWLGYMKVVKKNEK